MKDYYETNYKKWKDFFDNDPDLQMLKGEQSVKTEKLLSKVEYLRLVTASAFSDESYRKYKKSFKEKSEVPF